MMKKSYLEIKKESKTVQRKQSYIEDKKNNDYGLGYVILPEEYNVFEKLVNVDLSFCTEEQINLFRKICLQISQTLKFVYHKYGIIKVLPKMELSIDDENAIILNWPYNVYRIYFDIERNVSSSFYGLIVADAENSIQSKTEIITKENCAPIISNIIQYVFNRT